MIIGLSDVVKHTKTKKKFDKIGKQKYIMNTKNIFRKGYVIKQKYF